ncbi:MAG: XRE family transcriptional regulator [Clostridia bacterium]|nr:XRE family transcriptional regulator [Clostridia bacterium]
MIHAYDKAYLDKARTNLARMLDFAVYDLKYNISDFFDMFLSSGLAARFEKGDFQIVAGKSGAELAYDVLEILGEDKRDIKPKYTANRSEEYWTGWALAYYQWETGLTFAEIVKYISISEILRLYNPYHEMDIRQFVDKMNELYRAAKPDTNLF